MEVCESGFDPHKVSSGELDDDGKLKRTGNVWTASAHIITAIIGSGVLSLAWGVAQLGWVAGVSTLVVFCLITLYTSNLLADCYRSPDPVTGKRHYSYTDAVKQNLGETKYVACWIFQYANLWGMIIGYTITASISMVAIQKSNCFHVRGHESPCRFSNNPYMIGLGIVEIFLSQIRNFHKLSILSIVAAIMSFGYSSIGMGLAFAKVVSGSHDWSVSSSGMLERISGSKLGCLQSAPEKTWRMFSALGDIAFAFSYSQLLIEIQDTLKSTKPENKVMKKANIMAVSTTTIFYLMCGCLGYAAFGNNAPGNLLTGFGFYEPFWLVNLANVFIVVHLVGAYQVFSQPIFSAFESWANERWPKFKFVTGEYPVHINKKIKFDVNFLRLIWRTLFVIVSTILAMAVPFFNDLLAFLGALGFWPLTVFFPVEMYITQKRVRRWTCMWVWLQIISVGCFLVGLAAACGSIQGLSKGLRAYKPFEVKE